ncbi:MAG: hypothetical protein KAU14_02555, partial [Thermoplasmata archaeon]|nr:hypothetical protein [Thermoplasmata archaeon]
MLSVVMLGMLMIGALLPFYQVGSASPSGPASWKSGDKWCMGYQEELSMSFNYQEFLSKFFENETDLGDSEIEELDIELDGIVGAYLISEVLETSPQYKIKNTASFGLHGSFHMTITGNLYKEGHYTDVEGDMDENWDIPKERKTMELSIGVEIAVLAKGYEYRDVDTLAITRQTFSLETAGKITMETKDFIDEEEGDMDYDWENDKIYLDTLDISYGSVTLKYTWDAHADINILYSPGLNSVPPSENIGDVWNLSYTTTISGNYGGKIKASIDGDMPGEGEVSMSEKMDLTSSELNSPPFENGVIHEETEEVELQCEIVDREMVTMPDGSTVDCLVITQRDPDEYYDEDEEAAAYRYYSPTHHRTVMMKTADLSELDEDMPMSTYALSPQTVETAQTFNKKYADPSKVREGEGDDSVSMLLVGGILAIVSLAGIAFFLHHRRGAVEEDSWEDAAQGPYAGGGFAYARDTPGTFSGMPTASQQNHLCQRCGTAADYIPTYQRYYCWNCRDYLPLHAPRQTP